MLVDGRKAGTIHQIHRTFRTALNEAVRRGHLGRNPVQLAKVPRVREEEVEPYNVEEVQRLLRAADDRRNAARWAVALALGLRQGEALGLKCSDVDLERGVMMVRRSRRPAALRPWVRRHMRAEGRLLPAASARRTPRRPTRSPVRDGARSVCPHSSSICSDCIRPSRAPNARRPETTGRKRGGCSPRRPVGAPHPETDYDDWKELLDGVKVRDGRLHDARHTAATVLLILGVSERAVMGLMGWSTTAMAARYQHMVDSVRSDVARQVDGLIWKPGGDGAGRP